MDCKSNNPKAICFFRICRKVDSFYLFFPFASVEFTMFCRFLFIGGRCPGGYFGEPVAYLIRDSYDLRGYNLPVDDSHGLIALHESISRFFP